MLKKSIFVLFAAMAIAACGNDKPTSSEQVPAAETEEKANAKTLEELKAGAIAEDDVYGRVTHSLGTLQREYEATANQAPNEGVTGVYVDDKLNVVIKNERGSDVYETIFNLKDLNPEDGGMSLIPDNQPGEFPGLRIQVLEGRDGVKKYKNNKLVSEEKVWEIYMPQRPNIEKITPAISAALNVAHGKY